MDFWSGIGARHGRHERFGVGVERCQVERIDIGQFDDAAQVHDGDSVADVFDHREVVGNEDDRSDQTRSAGLPAG